MSKKQYYADGLQMQFVNQKISREPIQFRNSFYILQGFGRDNLCLWGTFQTKYK